ncbi:MAG: glutamate 5-kinase [Bdellovibrionota bacterium]|nr:glutamate 5-kinase [Bdellovibrionota bacterium]
MLRWRSEINKKLSRIVIKLGSNSITDPKGGVDRKKIKSVCEGIKELHKEKKEVILVCSGAIQTARGMIKSKSQRLSQLQALSSIGQNQVISAIQSEFSEEQTPIGQILLTHEDFKHPERYFNLQNTIGELLNWKALPVINENDCISFNEITLGDNDQLAALISENCNADLLLLLTESKGLYTAHPDSHDSEHIPYIEYDKDLSFIKTMNKSIAGRGGMKTKLEAVRKLTPLGVPVIIADYRCPSPVLEALASSESSSFFEAAPEKLNKKKARILTSVKGNCYIKIDKGAAKALESNKSLLPVGVKAIHGRFQRGDVIKVYHSRTLVAQGLAEFSSTELRKLINTDLAPNYPEQFNLPSRVFIHKNNLLLKK